MAKREKRPFVVEKLVEHESGVSDYFPYESDSWPLTTEFESTAEALAAIKREAAAGTFRVIQECATVNVVVEQVAKVSVSDITD